MRDFWIKWASVYTGPNTPSLMRSISLELAEHHAFKQKQIKQHVYEDIIKTRNQFFKKIHLYDTSTPDGKHGQLIYFQNHIKYLTSVHVMMNVTLIYPVYTINVLQMIIQYTDNNNEIYIERKYPVTEYYQLLYNVAKRHGVDVSMLPPQIA